MTAKRVELCLESASFWVEELPRYADRQQRLADRWAILAGVLSAITSLAIWPVLGQDSTGSEKVLISTVALLAAICALVPRVKNYGEMAGQARELCSRYGALVGDLLDLTQSGAMDQEWARAVVAEFQTTKAKKDSLRGLPDKATVEIRMAKRARGVAVAKQEATNAEQALVAAEPAAASATVPGAPPAGSG